MGWLQQIEGLTSYYANGESKKIIKSLENRIFCDEIEEIE